MDETKSDVGICDLIVEPGVGVRLPGNAEWSRTLADAREEYGHDNVDLFVLDHLPITPAEKLEIFKMVLEGNVEEGILVEGIVEEEIVEEGNVEGIVEEEIVVEEKIVESTPFELTPEEFAVI